jgi:metal-sulfur cluster biosynthetic enzyme
MDEPKLINPNPVIYDRKAGTSSSSKQRRVSPIACASSAPPSSSLAWHQSQVKGDERESIDSLEIFEHIKDITDPEHPYSLEQLNVVAEDLINVDDLLGKVSVKFTPTVPHCSMATLIGLCIRVQLLRCLPARFKVTIMVTPGSHASEAAVNKQLMDKERVAAALENPNLLGMVEKCLSSC